MAKERLVLFGGGNSPPEEAVKRFSDWAGGKGGNILLISWASSNVILGNNNRTFINEYKPLIEGAIMEAPPFSAMAEKAAKTHFLEHQLPHASGVFFSGGDQNRIMDVLADPSLFIALQRAFESGVVFGGTSAGTAIMSPLMLTGKEDLTKIDPENTFLRIGLGLLKNVILDQHFIFRQRHNRLMSALLKSQEALGIGIDEDAALSVVDSSELEVIGENQVLMIDKSQLPGKFVLEILSGGDKYDLVKRQKI